MKYLTILIFEDVTALNNNITLTALFVRWSPRNTSLHSINQCSQSKIRTKAHLEPGVFQSLACAEPCLGVDNQQLTDEVLRIGAHLLPHRVLEAETGGRCLA